MLCTLIEDGRFCCAISLFILSVGERIRLYFRPFIVLLFDAAHLFTPHLWFLSALINVAVAIGGLFVVGQHVYMQFTCLAPR